ncbi:MAG: deoxyguanosinetriphosphate triphosphohydrolase, partial [Clostridia bacterium]|nr:deoxyguanosinetriphosphate triphosphohydrolase [Clostridia bacterium]
VIKALHSFMFDAVYYNPIAKSEEDKVGGMITTMYEYYNKHPEKLPQEYLKNEAEDGIERVVCDYIAGMTDRYAISEYEKLFIPKVWQYK